MENKQLKNRIQHDMEFNETMRELEDAKQAKDDLWQIFRMRSVHR